MEIYKCKNCNNEITGYKNINLENYIFCPKCNTKITLNDKDVKTLLQEKRSK